MTHHSELINYIIKEKGLKSYFEIGTFNRAHNFEKIEAEEKYCVDPDPNAKADFMMTSDAYFAFLDKFNAEPRFDLVWIDGLHEAGQVMNDFKNASMYLNEGGFILFHDCNPPYEAAACVPRGTQREWCGDVYKAIMSIVAQGLADLVTVDMDYGCAVARMGLREPREMPEPSWQTFAEDKSCINLISVEDFYKWI